MIILGILGKKGSGKDTLADYMIQNHGFYKHTFAGPLKNCCRDLFHLSEDQLHNPILKEVVIPEWGLSPRQILQKVGTDLFRKHFSPDFWLRQFEFQFPYDKQRIVCSDVRFQNEADLILQFGGILIRVDRESAHLNQDSHESEDCDKIIGVQEIICNNGSLSEFYDKIDLFLSDYLLKQYDSYDI